MKARPGDHIVLAALHTSEATRDGVVREVRGQEGDPPYLVAWSDGREGLFYPGPGAMLRVGAAEDEEPAGDGAPSGRSSPEVPAEGRPRVRDWTVRVTVLEEGDDTQAHVVLLSDAPEDLAAEGHSHRSASDPAVPQIGDEVAVARALRRLADRLLRTAERDIEGVTGEHGVAVHD